MRYQIFLSSPKRWLFTLIRSFFGLVPAGAMLSLATLSASPIEQSFELQPGWNAIFLEVVPVDTDPAVALAGIPYESVWTREEPLSSVDFIQDQDEAAWNDPEWLVHFPADNPGARVASLFTIRGPRPYLIQIRGNVPVRWTVRGTPSPRYPDWTAAAYNLRGFPIDPSQPPSFEDFFRGRAAHHDPANGDLEPIYRMNAAGAWIPVDPSDPIGPGEAYWAYANASSGFVAPLEMTLEDSEGLDFGLTLRESIVRFRNNGLESATLLVSVVSGDPTGLARWNLDGDAGTTGWPVLSEPWVRALDVGAQGLLRLAPRRQTFSEADYGAVLQVLDGRGTRLWLPVSAQRTAVGALRRASNHGDSHPHAGLWVGVANVNAVAEVHSEEPGRTTDAQSAFPLRVLLHMDASGQGRLLKEVIQLWEDGTYREGDDGFRAEDEPGRHVLLSDYENAEAFTGVTLRDGVPVGRRLSSIGYDFDGGSRNALDLEGDIGTGLRLNGTLTLGSNHPTHPYRHRFHPDHDNLDVRFEAFKEEAFPITRRIEFEFDDDAAASGSPPDYGYGVLGGVYHESIEGIHHRPIRVAGRFRLIRVSDIGELNPEPRSVAR